MPIYEFQCEKCNHIDEVLMGINDPHPTDCTKCGGHVKKILSRTSFALKGGGWYATDYKSSGAQASPSKNESTSVSSDSSTTSTPAKPATGCGSGGCGHSH